MPVRVTNKYVDRVLAAAESDIVVAEQLAKVITLIDPPTRLLRPAVIVRVATVNLRRLALHVLQQLPRELLLAEEPCGLKRGRRACQRIGIG